MNAPAAPNSWCAASQAGVAPSCSAVVASPAFQAVMANQASSLAAVVASPPANATTPRADRRSEDTSSCCASSSARPRSNCTLFATEAASAASHLACVTLMRWRSRWAMCPGCAVSASHPLVVLYSSVYACCAQRSACAVCASRAARSRKSGSKSAQDEKAPNAWMGDSARRESVSTRRQVSRGALRRAPAARLRRRRCAPGAL